MINMHGKASLDFTKAAFGDESTEDVVKERKEEHVGCRPMAVSEKPGLASRW